MSDWTEKTLVHDMTAGQIAAIVAAVAGKKNVGQVSCLLGIAQAMHDMLESRKFGSKLSRVLRYHFPQPDNTCHENCLRVVEAVFGKNEKRNRDWKIYKVCKQSDGAHSEKSNGYPLLGTDPLPDGDVLCYYGKKRAYMVEVGSYLTRRNAGMMTSYLKEKSIDSRIFSEKQRYSVRVGEFYNEQEAKDYLSLLERFSTNTPRVVSEL